jgi:hypothetical protein
MLYIWVKSLVEDIIIGMSDIEFSSNQQRATLQTYKSRVVLGQSETPKLVTWLIQKGIVKNESQAGYVLLGVVGLFFLVAIFIFISMRPSPAVPYEESPHIQYEKK